MIDLFVEEKPKVHPYLRPHCSECGRFVPMASLRQSGGYPDYDYEVSGKCKTHGIVDVSWEKA